MSECTHIDQVKVVAAPELVCLDCQRSGDDWHHLRMCRSCGYVGCCDESPNQHARKHFEKSGHPIIQSVEPGEDWSWCFVDEVYVEFPSIADANPEAKRVIRSFLMISGIYTLSASLIWGVNTLFLLDAGLDIMGVFIANAVFTGSMALFEIPTGVLADTRGRRASFLLSVAIVLLGTLGYVANASIGGHLMGFVIMSIFLGLGYTFYSGAVEAWLVDALESTNYSGLLDKVFARGGMVSGAAMLLGSIGGGFLASQNLSYPFVLRAALLAIVFIIAWFTMHDMGFQPVKSTWRKLPAEMSAIASVSIRYGWREKPVRLLIMASLVISLFMAWGFHAWQPYFMDLLGQNLPWVAGFIAAAVALASMIGNSFVEWVTRFCGKRTTLLLWAVGVQAVVVIGVGVTTNFWVAVSLYLVAMIAMGVMGPVRQAFMHANIPSSQRASVISFDSLVSNAGSMTGQLGLGRLGQLQSLSAGYIVGGFITFLAVPVFLRLRMLKTPSDQIVGSAGENGPCAAQGLPSAAGLNTAAPNTNRDQ